MEEKIDFVSPTSDFVFKRIFGVESHKRVLVCLLNSILKCNPRIDSVSLENSEIPKDFHEGKDVRLDIKARTDKGTLCNIEIQCVNRGELIHRSAFYQARMMPEEITAGDDYNQIPDMISIWIADYSATKREHHTHEIIYMYKENEKDPIEIATSKFRTFIIELSKIEFKNLHHADMFFVWMTFVKHPEMIPEEFLSIPEVNEAMDELGRLSRNKEFRAEYEARQKIINDERSALSVARIDGKAEGREEGIAIGEAKGKAEGELKKARETALNLLAIGLSAAQISKATGLTLEEIESLGQQ
jgi:predicted transposase/invertase (TIGR01784 family)